MTLQDDLFIPQQRSEIRHEFVARSQGAEANHKGRELEQQVRDMFISRGAIVVPYQKYSRRTADMFDSRLLVRQYPYKTVMGQFAKADFAYFHGPGGARVGIECKVQDGGGSADEKLFVLYHNAIKWQFAEHIWLVVSGSGFRKRFIEWLETRAHIEYPSDKTVRVFRGLEGLRVSVKALVERGITSERG